MFTTEYEFELPKGYVDKNGTLHKSGIMRLATAADEILPLKDHRVVQNSAYITIIIFSRVITKLGTLSHIDTNVIENLFAADMNYLQALYEKINQNKPPTTFICPHCQQTSELPLDFFA